MVGSSCVRENQGNGFGHERRAHLRCGMFQISIQNSSGLKLNAQMREGTPESILAQSSIPELGSSSWGEPLEHQLDGWLCGVFVSMAIKAKADGGDESDWATVTDSRKNAMQKFMLKTISSVPVIPRVLKSRASVAVINAKEKNSDMPEASLGSDVVEEDTDMSMEEEPETVGGRVK
ncbi:hypothetical protein K438DRAFT_1750040 [Mycena galopus ATCC 62051]|nr:hypothetical protein K438DRAFT_1750040 [Mycena galopus ATCC 62051]